MATASKDLEAALTFVIERISEEANRSTTPLSDEEKFLLNHLPTELKNPIAYPGANEELLDVPTVRDLPYEKLCSLAKNAHVNDLRIHPEAAREWDFAATVLQLNRHPMSWLLIWAGMERRRPAWDGLLLVGTALLFVLLFILGAVLLSPLVSDLEGWKLAVLAAAGCVCITVVVTLYFAAQRLSKRHMERIVEGYRPDPNTRRLNSQ
jgi:hypothetical protein